MNSRRRSRTREIPIDAFVEEVGSLTDSERVRRAAEELGLDRDGKQRLEAGLRDARDWVKTIRTGQKEEKPGQQLRDALGDVRTAAEALALAWEKLNSDARLRLICGLLAETTPGLKPDSSWGQDHEAGFQRSVARMHAFETVLIALPGIVNRELARKDPRALRPTPRSERHQKDRAKLNGLLRLACLYADLTGKVAADGGGVTGTPFMRFAILSAPLVDLPDITPSSLRHYAGLARQHLSDHPLDRLWAY